MYQPLWIYNVNVWWKKSKSYVKISHPFPLHMIQTPYETLNYKWTLTSLSLWKIRLASMGYVQKVYLKIQRSFDSCFKQFLNFYQVFIKVLSFYWVKISTRNVIYDYIHVLVVYLLKTCQSNKIDNMTIFIYFVLPIFLTRQWL